MIKGKGKPFRIKEIYKMKLELDYNLSTLKARLGEIDLWKVELEKYSSYEDDFDDSAKQEQSEKSSSGSSAS